MLAVAPRSSPINHALATLPLPMRVTLLKVINIRNRRGDSGVGGKRAAIKAGRCETDNGPSLGGAFGEAAKISTPVVTIGY